MDVPVHGGGYSWTYQQCGSAVVVTMSVWIKDRSQLVFLKGEKERNDCSSRIVVVRWNSVCVERCAYGGGDEVSLRWSGGVCGRGGSRDVLLVLVLVLMVVLVLLVREGVHASADLERCTKQRKQRDWSD